MIASFFKSCCKSCCALFRFRCVLAQVSDVVLQRGDFKKAVRDWAATAGPEEHPFVAVSLSANDKGYSSGGYYYRLGCITCTKPTCRWRGVATYDPASCCMEIKAAGSETHGDFGRLAGSPFKSSYIIFGDSTTLNWQFVKFGFIINIVWIECLWLVQEHCSHKAAVVMDWLRGSKAFWMHTTWFSDLSAESFLIHIFNFPRHESCPESLPETNFPDCMLHLQI